MGFNGRMILSTYLASLVITRIHGFSTPRQCCRNERFTTTIPSRPFAFAVRNESSSSLAGAKGFANGMGNGRSKKRKKLNSSERKKKRKERQAWLEQATKNLLDIQQYPPGSLNNGKWHELTSMMMAWSKVIRDPELAPKAPLVIESLLKRIIDEQRAGNTDAHTSTELYNLAIDAWATRATSRFHKSSREHAAAAAQRAREILVLMQATYEVEENDDFRPDEHSFLTVLQALSKQKGGASSARDMLTWMEELYKSGRNTEAKPILSACIVVLDAFASSGHEDAGLDAEELLSHMHSWGIEPNTLCYNIAIKAWSRARRGRASAEHAERLLDETPEPDVVTYSSVIHAWATSGMRAHAAERAEEILNQMDECLPNVVTYNAVLNAWCKSKSRAAVERAEALLHRMEQEYQNGRIEGPDLISYNTFIHVLSMNGKEPGMAKRADDILLRLEEKYDAGELRFSPNLFSYNLVIEAWSKSRDKQAASRACAVLRRLVKRDGVDPDTFSFNQVISALSRSSLPGAARKAEELLLYMESNYRAGTATAKPDVITYASAIIAWSRSREDGSAQRAERLLNRMEARYAATGDEDLKPNAVSFNSVIDAWARSGEGTLGARKAESLLYRMQTLYESGDESMQPNIVTYNAVLNAWARSGTRCCAYKAEHYLDRMWQLYKAGNSDVKPDGMTYNTVINAISKSKNEGKAQKALRILRTMDKLYQAGDKDTRPNEFTYTSVLNSCAFPAVGDQRSKRKALDTAIFTLAELQESQYGKPNHVTYGTFLKACANLLPTEDRQLRRMVIERVFTQCCKDGQVGEMVLSRLRDAAPADLYEELLGGITSTGGTITIHDLPIEWRCNVKETRRWKDRWSRTSRSNHPRGLAKHRQRQESRELHP